MFKLSFPSTACLLLFAIFQWGCRPKADPPQPVAEQAHPITNEGVSQMLESGKKPGKEEHQAYLETHSLPQSAQHIHAPEKHPLSNFSLSYSEWETIGCIVSIDEAAYWNKYMIGLVQKSGKLRIQIGDNTILLKPLANKPFKEGAWANTYAKDSIRIELSAMLERKRIMRSLTGFGSVRGSIGSILFQEDSAFFVAKVRK